MKPLFILLTFLGSFFTKTSLAKSNNIAPQVVKAFETTFTDAKDIVWTINSNFYKVDFILNGQAVTAFYNEEGKLTAVTRNISSLQLPFMLQTEIKKDYSSYWITNLFELSNESGTEYYITLEDANNKVVLKSIANAEWSTYSKTKK